MEFRVFNCLLMMLLGLGVVVGCAPQGGLNVETVSVSGTVTLDGQPAEGIAVRMSKSTDHEGAGVTGPDGTYKLGNGAEAGENKVYFFKVSSVDGDEEEDLPEAEEADAGDEEDAEADAEGGLPAKYGDPETSETTFTVPAGGSSDANFQLTTK